MPQLDSLEEAQGYGRNLLLGRTVRLRPLLESDLPVLEAWWADPSWQVLQQYTVKPRPLGQMVETFRAWSRNDDPSGAGFSISPLQSDVLLGHVTVWGAAMPHRVGQLGILIGPEHVGKGHGTEALRVMTRYAFQQLGLHKLELTVASFNLRGIAAYERVGFVQEGIQRSAAFFAGSHHDVLRMGLLADEWREAQA